MTDPSHRPSDRRRPTNSRDHSTELEFTEYADEYGSIALLHDPGSKHAWIQSTHWAAVER